MSVGGKGQITKKESKNKGKEGEEEEERLAQIREAWRRTTKQLYSQLGPRLFARAIGFLQYIQR